MDLGHRPSSKQNYYCIAAKRNFCEWPDFCSQKKYLRFLNIISTARYLEVIWTHKCVLAFIFANAFAIAKFAKLNDSYTIQYNIMSGCKEVKLKAMANKICY